MKKVLLSSSAIVGLAFAGSASAADPIQLNIGGNLQTSLTVNAFGGDNAGARGGVTSNNDSLNMQQDWDLNFTGSTTLENGLTIGVYIQLDQGGNAIRNAAAAGATQDAGEDEVYAIISGGFGEFRIGQDDEALNDYGSSYLTQGGSMFAIDDGTYDVTLSSSLAASPTSPDLSIADNSAMIWYRTPRFAGFRLTASYAPDDGSEPQDSPSQADSTQEDAWSIGGEYENSFGGIDLGVYAAYSTANAQTVGADDPYSWLAGATVGVAGFTVGGGYNQAEEGGAQQGTAALSVSYSIDKVGVGIQGLYGFREATSSTTQSGTDRGWGIQVDGSYALGPGITFGAAVGYSAYDFGSEAAAGNTAGDIHGVGVGTSLAISF